MAREVMLDDEPTNGTQENQSDLDGIPYCRKHHCRMKLASGAAKSRGKDYYRCQVDGCNETGVRIRTIRDTIVPSSPQYCARCKTPTVCERDPRRSTGTMVVLACPACGWSLPPLAVPQLAAFMERGQKAPVPNIGDR